MSFKHEKPRVKTCNRRKKSQKTENQFVKIQTRQPKKAPNFQKKPAEYEGNRPPNINKKNAPNMRQQSHQIQRRRKQAKIRIP
jgi:hypothetical protein